MTTKEQRLREWHQMIAKKDVSGLRDWLAADIVFRSPTVWSPKKGPEMTLLILSNVTQVFEDFTYHRELLTDENWMLEFSAKIDGKDIKGIDLIHWNADGKIDQFEVFVRPLNGLQALFQHMNERIAAATSGA